MPTSLTNKFGMRSIAVMFNLSKRVLSAMMAFLIVAAPAYAAPPSNAPASPVASVSFVEFPRQKGEFASAIVIDTRTGATLYTFEADKRWSAASLTKLMGAMVIADLNLSWSRVVTLKAVDEIGGGRLRVPTGASMRLVDLLYSSLVGSANNAATALARLSGLGMKGFVTAMNRKAKALKLTHTTFVDASGMDPKNVTTAREMARLAMAAYRLPVVRLPATTALYRFTVRNTGLKKEIKNTNKLLTDPAYDDVYVTGGKTGFLYESQYNLAVQVRPSLSEKRQELMIVVFGAPSMTASFASAHRLAKWAWSAYDWAP